MAKIKFSVGIAAASGKVGGNVFSRNGSGAYLKTFAMPVNPNTSKQQAVRAAFAVQVAAWRGLSAAQQQAWKDIASQYPSQDALGNKIQYSGQQLFIKLNQNLTTAGQSGLSSPKIPQSFTVMSLDSFAISTTAGLLTEADVDVSAVGAATEAFILTVTPGLSGGITSPGKSQFRKVQVVADASLSSTTDIIASYQALYGNPELGAKVFVSVSILNKNTGQKLNLGRIAATVGGT